MPEELEALFKDVVWVAQAEGLYKGACVSVKEVAVEWFTGRWVKRVGGSADLVEKWSVRTDPHEFVVFPAKAGIHHYFGIVLL